MHGIQNHNITSCLIQTFMIHKIFKLEPPCDKTNKVSVRPAKTQWVAKDPSFLHADSEDWSDWADAQADLSLCWVHNHIVGFVMRRLIYQWMNLQIHVKLL